MGIGAQKLDTIESHPARLREDAQQPDMIAAIPLGSFSMLQRRSNAPRISCERRSPSEARAAGREPASPSCHRPAGQLLVVKPQSLVSEIDLCRRVVRHA